LVFKLQSKMSGMFFETQCRISLIDEFCCNNSAESVADSVARQAFGCEANNSTSWQLQSPRSISPAK